MSDKQDTSTHLVVISSVPEDRKRVQDLSDFFNFNALGFETVDEFLEKMTDDHVKLVVLCGQNTEKVEDIIGQVQVIHQIQPQAFLLVIANKKLREEQAKFIKRSGASLVLNENHFKETSQLEFVCSQVIRASMIPIKPAELLVNTTITFNVIYNMPMNHKMVTVVPAGTVLNESRKKKLDQVGELYVLRKDVELYKDYTIKNTDASAEGLKGRCRSQFLSLSSSHSDFVFLLIDQSENASFEKGKQLYEKCETLAKDLLTNLSSVNDVADVVNTGSFGDMSPLERSASLAGFAGLASFISSMGDPVQVMVAALLCNIGLLQLSPKITGHLIKHRKADGLSAAEMAEYSRHPALSVEICLSKKLGLVDKLRTILNCTHVRADGKGFPNNVFGEKIPIESQLIHFCEMVDDTYLLGAAEQGKSFVDIRKEIYESEVKNAKIFTIEAMSKIRTWIT